MSTAVTVEWSGGCMCAHLKELGVRARVEANDQVEAGFFVSLHLQLRGEDRRHDRCKT